MALHRHQHNHTRFPEDPTSHPHHPRLPIRDLRFEYSYIHSIQSHVEFRRGTQGESTTNNDDTRSDEDESGCRKEKEPRPLSTYEVINIQWGKVAWITIRDQIISPLLQGTFWALASYFLSPISVQLGHRVSEFTRSRLPSNEGRGAGWLRSWVKSLGFGMSMTPRRP